MNQSTSPPISMLTKYSGEWSIENASHLLRRSTYGASLSDIGGINDLGLDVAIELLFSKLAKPNPPLNYNYDEDPDVAIGETWVGHPPTAQNQINYRKKSMAGWTIEQMLRKEINIQEKMTLFWHNHFVISQINDPRYYYKYISLLRENCLGNFRQLTKDITIDPGMLRYLNGAQNSKNAPNENYARELLELFTIGKGPQVAAGDYTNYTEDDIIEIAKILTGWRIGSGRDSTTNELTSNFVANRHDQSTKTLSHRFDNISVSNELDKEYQTLIDIIFTKNEVARFMCRNLYRWFVFYDITDEIEENIIIPMAEILIKSDYEIKPALQALLSSEHFYSEEIKGCMIKNPLDLTLGLIKQFEVFKPSNLEADYKSWIQIFQATDLLQMAPFDLPSVAGWKAYYQEPSYYQIWINSVSMPLRKLLTDSVALEYQTRRGDLGLDALAFIQSLSNPFVLDLVISDLNMLLFARPLEEHQFQTLKQVVLQGLPDFEWSDEYALFASNPTDKNLAVSIDAKVRSLLVYMMRMPEYQMS